MGYTWNYIGYLVVLEGYSDVNWIFNTKDSKSTIRYIFILDGVVLSRKSFKQTCIIKFMMESEFIALDKVRNEAEWLWNFLDDISC